MNTNDIARKISIVRCTEEDIDEIESLYNDVTDRLQRGINYPGWKKGIYPARCDAEKGISERSLYAAKYDGRIIGTIILNHEPEKGYAMPKWKSSGNYEKIFVVHTFAVHPEYLKMGVGIRLLRFADELAAEHKMKAIRLDVYYKNDPAVRLYEKCGYRYIDTLDLGYADYGLELFKLYEKVL